MEDRPSKEYTWKFLTTTELLSKGPCELVYAEVVPSATTTTTIIYDGENTLGRKIIQFNITIVLNWNFRPAKPVYCAKGLYVVKGDDVTGVFVMWRELGHEEKQAVPA